MMKILVFKEKLKKIYSTHSLYIIPAIRFLAVLTSLLVINSNIGFMSKLNHPAAAIFIAASKPVSRLVHASVSLLLAD